MSAICRLASRQMSPGISYFAKPQFLTLARHVTLKPAPFKAPPELDHDERNLQFHRPQSPHLSIYAFQLTSTLSISHRITGTILTGYTALLGAGALVLPNKISYYIDALQEIHPSSATLFVLKFALAFPFSYHFCNGIRHLSWDLAKFLTLKEVYSTGYIMLGSATVLTIILTLL